MSVELRPGVKWKSMTNVRLGSRGSFGGVSSCFAFIVTSGGGGGGGGGTSSERFSIIAVKDRTWVFVIKSIAGNCRMYGTHYGHSEVKKWSLENK